MKNHVIHTALLLLSLAIGPWACERGNATSVDSGPDGQALDSGGEAGAGDADADLDGDGDSDADADAGRDAGTDAGLICNCVRYVDIDSAASSPDGLSWATAFGTVQQGINSAYEAAAPDSGPPCCEVWVAEGTYHIFQTDRIDTVQLRSDVHVYGGFAGNETSREERDFNAHETILDGRKDDHDADAAVEQVVLHVVWAKGCDQAVLDGVTVTHGRADVAGTFFPLITPNDMGGGMVNWGTSIRVSNCLFLGNYAMKSGGAVNDIDSQVTFSNCLFLENQAEDEGGGAIYHWLATYNYLTSLTISHSTFINNMANQGGAIENDSDSMMIEKSVFGANVAALRGGGIFQNSALTFLAHGLMLVKDTVFTDNVVTRYLTTRALFESRQNRPPPPPPPPELPLGGGAIYTNTSNDVLAGCIFNHNKATSGGGVYASNYDDHYGKGCALRVKKSLFTGNQDEAISNECGNVVVDNSVIIGNKNNRLMNMAENALTIKNSDIVENDCSTEAWEDYFDNTGISNSIVWGNHFGGNMSGIGTPQVSTSDVEGYAGGQGNIDEDPKFVGNPLSHGTWSKVTFNPTLFQTELEDSAADWSEQSLAGLFVKPDTSGILSFVIAGNTKTQIMVWGDITAETAPGSRYEIDDYHLRSGSPCIDHGDDISGTSTDLEGHPRQDIPNIGVPGTRTDMGAYEYVP